MWFRCIEEAVEKSLIWAARSMCTDACPGTLWPTSAHVDDCDDQKAYTSTVLRLSVFPPGACSLSSS